MPSTKKSPKSKSSKGASAKDHILWLEEARVTDVPRVGGKNASLGEMIANLSGVGVKVPGGFATTSQAYRYFVAHNGLDDVIREQTGALAESKAELATVGKTIRSAFLKAAMPKDLGKIITDAYRDLGEREGKRKPDVAVRSSATAEDLPDASFAGQQESYLNICGKDALLEHVRKCYASLFTDRAITYRNNNGFDHLEVALSVGVQRMVRSDTGAAGVMFSIDTETGFPDMVLITGAWGLGEAVVQGIADPDEFMVFKPLLENDALSPIVERSLGTKEKKLVYADGGKKPTKWLKTKSRERAQFTLSNDDVLQLARWAVTIEKHYGCPMDIEWAKDGNTGELAIVQARPETVQSRAEASGLKTFHVSNQGKKLTSGLAVGSGAAVGKVINLASPHEIDKFEDGAVLVTSITDPDWVPIMKRASAIVTDHGGRTSHAAIVSRELGLTAIVGCHDATAVLKTGTEITASCAEGDEGHVYAGIADIKVNDLSLDDMPETRTKLMLNMATPSAALRWWRLPSDGIGLARLEFVINNIIKVHPLALTRFDQVKDKQARKEIEKITIGYDDKTDYFVNTLAEGVARLAASQYPHPVIVRMSDFKTNEYAELIGGRQFEPNEENPMIGWRGASRYYSDDYSDGFALECEALMKVRREMGFSNVVVMIPFCRTLEEADATLETMASHGLVRGEDGLEVYVMCEVPSNVILADEFSKRFDGFSIGSNDLTQLPLGVDRDSARLAHLFDEENPAVKRMIETVIGTAHEHTRKVGLCGQGPSDKPEFAKFLVATGIDSMSVTPDSFLHTKQAIAKAEEELDEAAAPVAAQ
ncbi:MAG: phosphoenolpyruvate synthase [Candidatus Phaeomarinobacter sp.]